MGEDTWSLCKHDIILSFYHFTQGSWALAGIDIFGGGGVGGERDGGVSQNPSFIDLKEDWFWRANNLTFPS